ncbi:MAG TPA: hypothetical protein VMR45_04635 [Patescibacteria group bacterium]|nr:hypothetical protein [Patescibacteria group bacterium]
MAGNIGELGDVVHQIFDDQLGALVAAAAERADVMAQAFDGLGPGSSNEHFLALREQLAEAKRALGEAAVAAGAMEQSKANLMANWGIDLGVAEQATSEAAVRYGQAATYPDTTAAAKGPSSASREALLGAECQTRLNTPWTKLVELATEGGYTKHQITRTLGVLRRAEISTARDTMLVGGNSLLRLDNLGYNGIRLITECLAKHFPETPLPLNPDPRLAAKLCQSLEDVPWYCASPAWGRVISGQRLAGGRSPYIGERMPSMHDLVNRPWRDLFEPEVVKLLEASHLYSTVERYVTAFNDEKSIRA